MPTSKANRPTQGDGIVHKLLGDEHLCLARARLATEMLELCQEIRAGGPLSPHVVEAMDRAHAAALHLCETLQQKYRAPAAQPSIYQLGVCSGCVYFFPLEEVSSIAHDTGQQTRVLKSFQNKSLHFSPANPFLDTCS